jgi:hypothetical protein
VPDDPEMVTRIVSALPDRSSRPGWLIPRFAALTAIVLAAVMWSTRERPAAPARLPSTPIATLALPPVVVAREPGTVVRTMPLELSELSEPSEPSEPLSPDFDRSLPALMVMELTPVELPASAALALAPIGVADLPLTAETFSPPVTKEF